MCGDISREQVSPAFQDDFQDSFQDNFQDESCRS